MRPVYKLFALLFACCAQNASTATSDSPGGDGSTPRMEGYVLRYDHVRYAGASDPPWWIDN